MSAPVLLAVDLGTSSCKVVLYRGDRMLAADAVPIATVYPGPDRAEQDPGAWWEAVCTLVRRVAGSAAGEVAAVGVTGQSDSLVAVDVDGDPVHPCILWMDGRGEDELQRLRAALGDGRIREVTGLRPSLSFTAAKVAWLRMHEPAAFARTRWILQPKDYLVLRMTNTAVTDPSSASRSMLLDRRSGTWWPEMASLVGVTADQLPPILPSSAVAGGMTAGSALALGLRQGILVVAGAADRAAEALATGVTGDEAMVSMGTATGIVMSIPRTAEIHDAAILTPSHALPDRALALASVSTSGAALEWLLGILGGDQSVDSRRQLMAEAADSPPGARGATFLPFLRGAKSVRWSQAARGLMAGLDLSTRRGDLIRAALEGATFEAAACVRRLAAARGPIGRLVLVGGAQRQDLAGQLLADVVGVPALRLDEPHAGATGAMLLAGQAVGAWRDPLAVARARRRGDDVMPDAARSSTYREIVDRYEALCQAVGLPQVDLG